MKYNGFTEDYIDRLHEEALKVLDKVGLCVAHEGALKELEGKGLKVLGDRVYMAPGFVNEQLQSLLDSIGAGIPYNDPAPTDRISIGCCDMPQYYADPRTGEIGQMTCRSLIEATKFMENLKDRNAWSMVPGVPRDVPQQLQAITEYFIGTKYCSNGGNMDTLSPDEAIPYIFEMAEAMERPIRGFGMFTISPLKIGGFEFDTALKYRDLFEQFHVSSAPTMGVGSPIYPSLSWIISIAETLGSIIVLHLLSGGKPVLAGMGMFPFDLRSMVVVGGAPEYVIMEYHRYLVTKRYNPHNRYTHTLSTMAKHTDVQSGAEKAYGAVFAVLHGCRDFNGAGLMSFDDIFSPQQVMADIEIRDMVERLIADVPEPPVQEWLSLIAEGAETGYLETDATLGAYKDVYHFPRLFDRSTLHTFNSERGSKKSVQQKMRDEAVMRIETWYFNPPQDKLEEVRRIFHRAWEKLAPGVENPLADE
jgi:trimethylamine:corrinoid methyltransferase-like protein